MNNALRGVRLLGSIVSTLAVLAIAARAERLDAPQWRFNVTFPCQSALGGQQVSTAVGTLVITTFSCDSGNNDYTVAINDFPAGSVKPENLDNVYASSVNGVATNTKGTIRSVTGYTLGNYTGREALIDIPESKSVIRTHLFIVGDRMYQVMFIGAVGTESGKDGLDFLNSFVLLPK